MTIHTISLHIDRPERLREPLGPSVLEKWGPALQEVSQRTAATFGCAIMGLHNGQPDGSRYYFFAALAHKRGSDGRFMQPENPADRLYDENGNPFPDAMSRSVTGLLVDAAGRRADDHVHYTLTPDQYVAVQNYIQPFKDGVHCYHGANANCIRFALGAFAVAGLELPSDRVKPTVARMRRPEDVAQVLAAVRWSDHRLVLRQVGVPALLGK